MAADDRPDILLILTDQHSKHVTGCYGDEIVETPHIDGLAARGTVFTSAYCNSPLCCPSRMSFLTGRHPYEIEVWENHSVLRSDIPTFAHALGRAGYETALCGRMHINGPDQRHGFRSRPFPEFHGANAWGNLRRTNNFLRTSMEMSGPGRNHYLLYDQECAEAAVRWLRHRAYREDREPFCLVVGFVGPHCPFVCPPELFEKYFDRVSLPEIPDGYLERQHPFYRRFRERSKITDLTEHEIRRTRAAYYGMVEFDDLKVGEILGALHDSGLADSTAVFYASDHGEMAGEHGLWWKQSFFEGSAGIPLVVSWPGHLPECARVEAPVSLLDLAPTFTDLAGAEGVPNASGRSLLPLLRGEDDGSGRVAYSEIFATPRLVEQGPSGGPARMLRRGEWKCSYYHDEPAELFNLAEDPNERANRAGDPDCAKFLQRMQADILAEWNPESVLERAAAIRANLAYVKDAPADPDVLAGEYWRPPDGYGWVNPV